MSRNNKEDNHGLIINDQYPNDNESPTGWSSWVSKKSLFKISSESISCLSSMARTAHHQGFTPYSCHTEVGWDPDRYYSPYHRRVPHIKASFVWTAIILFFSAMSLFYSTHSEPAQDKEPSAFKLDRLGHVFFATFTLACFSAVIGMGGGVIHHIINRLSCKFNTSNFQEDFDSGVDLSDNFEDTRLLPKKHSGYSTQEIQIHLEREDFSSWLEREEEKERETRTKCPCPPRRTKPFLTYKVRQIRLFFIHLVYPPSPCKTAGWVFILSLTAFIVRSATNPSFFNLFTNYGSNNTLVNCTMGNDTLANITVGCAEEQDHVTATLIALLALPIAGVPALLMWCFCATCSGCKGRKEYYPASWSSEEDESGGIHLSSSEDDQLHPEASLTL